MTVLVKKEARQKTEALKPKEATTTTRLTEITMTDIEHNYKTKPKLQISAS